MLNPATQYFNRPVTHTTVQLTHIANAYKAYGLEPPTRALDIRRAIEAGAASVHKVTNNLARDAFATDQPIGEWYAGALEQIRDAIAREQLTKAFVSNYDANLRMMLPKLLADAATDLAPHIGKTMKALTESATHLPEGSAALDPEANLAADTGKHLTRVRDALNVLGTVAAMHPTIINDPIIKTPGLKDILPIVDFPTAVVERREANLSETPRTTNEDELAGTRTIRQIDRDLHYDGIDIVLVSIAQGAYPDTSLAWADHDTLQHRIHNVRRGFERVRDA